MSPAPTARVTAVDLRDTCVGVRRDAFARRPHPGGGFRAADRDSRKENTA
ncbi:hypothetical protein [Streptomyces rishiriensis]